jgi:hypothetical protein
MNPLGLDCPKEVDDGYCLADTLDEVCYGLRGLCKAHYVAAYVIRLENLIVLDAIVSPHQIPASSQVKAASLNEEVSIGLLGSDETVGNVE